MSPEEILRQMYDNDPFSQWMGMRPVDIGAGYCTLEMTVRPEMLNGFGVAHGGIAFSLADSAFAFACNTGGSVTVSIENSVTYPAPVRVGDVLTAVAAEEATSTRLGYYRAEVTNQRGEVVALFRGTAFRTSRTHETV